jgi:hypothetical protein
VVSAQDVGRSCGGDAAEQRHGVEQLGARKPIDEIIASMNQVAEGVKASSVIMEFAARGGARWRGVPRDVRSSAIDLSPSGSGF